MKPATDLRLDLVAAPLRCYLAGCDPGWSREIRKQVPPMEGLSFHELPREVLVADSLPHGTLVVMGITKTALPRDLRLIHELFQRGCRVIAAGPADIRDYSLQIRAAGAIAIVTDIFGCDKVADIIRKAGEQQAKTPGSWQTRFVNRLPWNPV